MSRVRVIRAGLSTTVQDTGRWGWQHVGVPVSGAMDLVSHRLANALVGNSPDAATLEVTLDGPELEFDDERAIAVCGAQFDLTLNDRPVRDRCAIDVAPGARLRFRARREGSRAYLAAAGGFDVPPTLGSRATHSATRMGGLGRPLTAGDTLPLGAPANTRPDDAAARAAARAVRLPGPGGLLRLLPGPHADRFHADALGDLQSGPYAVTPESDRMGFRLNGPSIRQTDRPGMLSDATVHGALQVPPDGQPILLMADRQTTGGYPALAVVIAADLGMAGQLVPGDEVRFAVCSRDEAATALAWQERGLSVVEGWARP